MADLSTLSNATTALSSLSNLILVSPQKTIGYQPLNDPNSDGTLAAQLPTLVFHYEGEQTVVLRSDVTDHYVEDNTAIQDQIALQPERVTTHGFIGELTDLAPPGLATLKQIATRLTTIAGYVPGFSATAILAYNEAAFLEQTALNSVQSLVATAASITGTGGESVINANGIEFQPNQNNQQTYFQQFYGYWRTRTLFTVQTPWAVFEGMVIESLRAIQDAETDQITDFEITFKLMRFAKLATASSSTTFDNNNFSGQLYQQGSDPVNLGPQPASESSTAFAYATA